MTVMLKAELEVQRRLQHPLRHRYARFTKVLSTTGAVSAEPFVEASTSVARARALTPCKG